MLYDISWLKAPRRSEESEAQALIVMNVDNNPPGGTTMTRVG